MKSFVGPQAQRGCLIIQAIAWFRSSCRSNPEGNYNTAMLLGLDSTNRSKAAADFIENGI